MDETRAQAYLQLIQTLLTCPNGEENQILNANSELVDSELVQTMVAVAAQLSENNQENAATFLLQTATQIANLLGMNDDGERDNSQPEYSQEYVKFILELFQAEAASQGDIKVIYPMLAQRQHLLNSRFAETLQQVAQTLAEYPEEIESIVPLIGNLSIHISGFPLGSRANNIEIAITGYQILLNNLEPGSENFAQLQFARNLACQIAELMDGSNGSSEDENHKESAKLLLELLQTEASNGDISYTKVTYTMLEGRQHLLNGRFAEILQQVSQRLITENQEIIEFIVALIENLSIHISEYPDGNRENNLEIAITGYQIVLSNREPGSEKFAQTQYNLANDYSNRIKGSRADNLERAIEFYDAALTVRTLEDFPETWANTQNCLAAAYTDRIKGSRADNLELAIACYQAALTVRTLEDFPETWANTQNCLAAAYTDRIKGSRADNLELAIELYQAALRVYTFEDFPKKWAMIQNNLANAYKDRIINGSRADNLELAIEFCQAALRVFTFEDFPENWANTQNSLAAAYTHRINGSRADNLELAIELYQAALKVYTFEDFPEQSARVQNNLANVYKDIRIKGSRADNLELAIELYQAALKVYTFEDFPKQWANTQNNLAVCYTDRIKGLRADNLEQAIASYTAALTIYKPDAFPEDWAMTQNNLAIAYTYRIRGEKAENIEQAIASYTAALTIYKPDAFPEDWAMTQNNLAAAYTYRIRGEKAENIEQAIAYHTAVLTIRTPDAFPEDWATTQNNLAAAYSHRIRGEKAENIEQAIASYTAALTIRTPDAFPEDWAMTQNNLAAAYSHRIRGEKAENIEQAIASYTAALTIRTPDAFPEDWATTQNNLATAYSHRIRGEKAENLKLEIASYTAALTIHTREAFPQDHSVTLFNLGLAYRKVPNLQLAYNTFAAAIETVEYLRGEIHSGDESKQKLAEEWIKLYFNMVEVCLELKNYTKAIEYVERSKARNLVELVATRDLYPKGDIPETVLNELSRLRREIDAEQRRLDNQQTNRNSNGGIISGERSLQIDILQTTSRDQTNLTQLWQQLDELLVRDIQPIDPDFLLNQEVKGISYSDIQALTAENTAIVQWYILGDKFLTFIITPQSPTPIVWQSSKADFQALLNWGKEYLTDYVKEDKTQWRENLAPRLQSLSEILHINEILGRVPKHCDQLILIPHCFLHLFPIHALPISREIWQRFNPETQSPEPTNPCLLDCFKQGVRYSPSCQLLQQAQSRKRPNFTHLFAVQNPTNDLQFTDLEVPAISQHFHPKDILVKNDAKKSVIDQWH